MKRAKLFCDNTNVTYPLSTEHLFNLAIVKKAPRNNEELFVKSRKPNIENSAKQRIEQMRILCKLSLGIIFLLELGLQSKR